MLVDKSKLSSFSAGEDSADAFSPEGLWNNELGSTLNISGYDGTNFWGTYTSAVGQSGGASGTVAGTINGTAIGFTVNWETSASSVTSWTGIILANGDSFALYTLWQLATSPASPDEAWESILAGADLFIPAFT